MLGMPFMRYSYHGTDRNLPGLTEVGMMGASDAVSKLFVHGIEDEWFLNTSIWSIDEKAREKDEIGNKRGDSVTNASEVEFSTNKNILSWNNLHENQTGLETQSAIFSRNACVSVTSILRVLPWGYEEDWAAASCQWGCWNAASQGLLVDVPKCAKMCCKQMCLQKGPVRFRNSALWYDKYIFIKEISCYSTTAPQQGAFSCNHCQLSNDLFLFQSLKTGCWFGCFFSPVHRSLFCRNQRTGPTGPAFTRKSDATTLASTQRCFLAVFRFFSRCEFLKQLPNKEIGDSVQIPLVCQCFWWFCWVSRLLNHHN